MRNSELVRRLRPGLAKHSCANWFYCITRYQSALLTLLVPLRSFVGRTAPLETFLNKILEVLNFQKYFRKYELLFHGFPQCYSKKKFYTRRRFWKSILTTKRKVLALTEYWIMSAHFILGVHALSGTLTIVSVPSRASRATLEFCIPCRVFYKGESVSFSGLFWVFNSCIHCIAIFGPYLHGNHGNSAVFEEILQNDHQNLKVSFAKRFSLKLVPKS